MLVTEEEAKERWCPFARQDGDTVAYNRWGGFGETEVSLIRCIGSQCMAWRWTETAMAGLTRDGYCGLAGNPRLAADFASQRAMTDKP